VAVLGDPDWPALRARLGDLAEEGIPGAAVTLAEMLATGRGERTPIARAAGGGRRGGRGDPQALRLLGWMRCKGVGGAWTAPAGLAALERAAMAGNGAAATDLGLHRDGRACRPILQPRATGSNARPRRAMAGAQRTSRGSWATGTTAYPTIPARLCALPRGRRAGHRGGHPWPGAGLLGRDRHALDPVRPRGPP
jgi:hypothetical protein